MPCNLRADQPRSLSVSFQAINRRGPTVEKVNQAEHVKKHRCARCLSFLESRRAPRNSSATRDFAIDALR